MNLRSKVYRALGNGAENGWDFINTPACDVADDLVNYDSDLEGCDVAEIEKRVICWQLEQREPLEKVINSCNECQHRREHLNKQKQLVYCCDKCGFVLPDIVTGKITIPHWCPLEDKKCLKK